MVRSPSDRRKVRQFVLESLNWPPKLVSGDSIRDNHQHCLSALPKRANLASSPRLLFTFLIAISCSQSSFQEMRINVFPGGADRAVDFFIGVPTTASESSAATHPSSTATPGRSAKTAVGKCRPIIQEWSSPGCARIAGSLGGIASSKARNKHRSTLIFDDSGMRFQQRCRPRCFSQSKPPGFLRAIRILSVDRKRNAPVSPGEHDRRRCKLGVRGH